MFDLRIFNSSQTLQFVMLNWHIVIFEDVFLTYSGNLKACFSQSIANKESQIDCKMAFDLYKFDVFNQSILQVPIFA